MLLTSEEVGGDFVEEYRGKVTFDVAGSLWPAGREAAGEALEVLSSESTSGERVVRLAATARVHGG
jgi:hypothetical protein